MKIELIKVRDTLTPDVKRRIKALNDPTKALKAMGSVIVSITQRAFTTASLRPASWAPLSAKTIARRLKDGRGTSPLLRTGTLARSPRITSLSRKSVSVGSDRAYAAHQQFGTRRGVPARPFFPFDTTGRPTRKSRDLMLVAANRSLGLGGS